jgi:hypothetical protein
MICSGGGCVQFWVGCAPVRRGRYVEVVLGAGGDEIVVCDGMVCGAMVVRVCVWLVVWSVFEITASELRAQRRSGLGYRCHR